MNKINAAMIVIDCYECELGYYEESLVLQEKPTLLGVSIIYHENAILYYTLSLTTVQFTRSSRIVYRVIIYYKPELN